MKHKNKFKTDLFWSVFGSYFYAGAQWIFLIILVRKLTPSDVGEFSYWVSIFSPIILFLNLKLRSVMATDAVNEYSLSEYYSLRSIAMFIFYVTLSLYVLNNLKLYDSMILICAIGLSRIIESLSDIYHGALQKQEKHKLIAISKIFKGFMQVGCVLIFATYFNGLAMVGVVLMISSAISYFIIDKLLLRSSAELVSVRNNFSPQRMFRLFKLALPLGFATMSGSLLENMPKYFINSFFGNSQLGYFSMVSTIVLISSTVIAAVAQVFSPRMAVLFHSGDVSNFIKLTNLISYFVILFGILVLILTIQFGEIFLSAVYGHDYANQNYVLICLMISFGIRSAFVFYGTAIQSMRIFNLHYKIDLFMLVISALLMYTACIFYGFNGLLIAIIFSSIVEGGFYYMFFVKITNIKIKELGLK